MRFRTFFNRSRLDSTEVVDEVSITHPDKSLSIKQILAMYTRGEDVSAHIGNFGGYDEESDPDSPFDPINETPYDYFNALGLDPAEAFQVYRAYEHLLSNPPDQSDPPVNDSPQAPAQPDETRTEDPPDPSPE